MQIDSYKFGKIVVDGLSYNADIIILGDSVHPDWWRKQGHVLSHEDLQPVIDAQPSILVVGCGAVSMMKVPEQTRQVLTEHNIRLEEYDTDKAVKRFNQLSKESAPAAAALHLTC